jgi:hypothetical protein
MPKTKSKTKSRLAKLRKRRITRKLRSRRRRLRDCSWMNLPMKHRGGSRPAEMSEAYAPIREVIPVVGAKGMYTPDTASGSYYGYNTNPSLPDPVPSNDRYQRGGSLLPRDLVDLGRNTMHSIQKFYGGLTTQPVPASPSVIEQPIGEKSAVIMPETSVDLEKIYADI